MARKLKVFGGCLTGSDRTIVAATTKKRAAELLRVSIHYFNSYCNETGNEAEVQLALSNPEVVYRKGIDSSITLFKEVGCDG